MSNNVNANGLLNTNAKVEPVGVVYNITGKTIEEHIYKLIANAGINGIETVKVQVTREGSNHQEVVAYAFFRQNSSDVISNMGNIPQHIARKMESSGFRASEKLTGVLRGISRDGKLGVRQNLVYAKLDIFRCLGVILDCDPRVNRINITETARLKKDNNCILTVLKSLKYGDGPRNEDKFDKLIDSLER